jgi:pyridinium-3,5-bisthiocarboxylic acid mononucleotide nickel chelatase
MSKIAWFHPISGIAGDMALGALLDAGADLDAVTTTVRGLGVDGWSLGSERVERSSLAATRALVDAPEQHHHRRWGDIRELLAAADLPDRVRDRASRIFEALAVAEAEVHGITPDEVHFHEVGALDAIVDIVGVCAALESLDVDTVHSAPVRVGVGSVKAAHGVLPNPAPAVVRLLEGIPTVGVDVELELTTPTGAAIIAALAESIGPMPTMTIGATGFGAGNRDLPGRPNVTQVVLGEPAGSDERFVEQLVELTSNLDDVTGELLAHTIESLLAQGALDAWATPMVMKKGRPAHTVHALCRPADKTAVLDTMFRLTGTLGVREQPVDRHTQPRHMVMVEIDGHSIAVKIGPERAKAEFDDVVAAAEALGRSPRDLAAEAEAAALRQGD